MGGASGRADKSNGMTASRWAGLLWVMDIEAPSRDREGFPIAQSESPLELSRRDLKVNFDGDLKRPF